MLRKIFVNNYKLFDNFELEFSDGVTLVCGPNGSGKSSLLEILYALGRFLAMQDVSDRVAITANETFPFSVFSRWTRSDNECEDLKILLEVEDENKSGTVFFIYDLLIRYNYEEHICHVRQETLKYKELNKPIEMIYYSAGRVQMTTDNNKTLSFKGDRNLSGLVQGSLNNGLIRLFGEIIGNITALHLLPSSMVKDFPATPPKKSMGRWGEDFPAWRFNCASEYPEKQLQLFETCKNFIPGLVSISDKALGDMRRLAVRVNFNGESYELSFNELSDGQKKLLAMYSILVNAKPHSTVIIDEPENYLSPGELQPWLNAMHDTWEEKDVQFIIITHNPKTLNWYHKEAVVLKISGTPPQIVPEIHDGKIPLIDKLNEMEWETE